MSECGLIGSRLDLNLEDSLPSERKISERLDFFLLRQGWKAN